MNLKNWKLNALIVGSLVLLTVIFAPTSNAAEQRLLVRVTETFEVNGETFAPANLTLRQVGDYNPTATINEVWVGNKCLGMLLAREVDTSLPSDTDSFVFTRNAEGTLVLIGVTFRGEPARELYGYNVAQEGGWMPPGMPASTALLASK